MIKNAHFEFILESKFIITMYLKWCCESKNIFCTYTNLTQIDKVKMAKITVSFLDFIIYIMVLSNTI